MNIETAEHPTRRRPRGAIGRWSSIAMALAAIATSLGCTIWGAPRASFRDDETALAQARAQATIPCVDAAQCDAVWARAERFVRSGASTRIVRSDDRAVETASPPAFGVAWFWAMRESGDDGGTTVRLKGMCRGMYDADGRPGWLYETCARQIADRARAFRQSVMQDR